MPQLPSGRQAALSPDRIMGMAREGNFTLTMALEADAAGSFDILNVLDVVGFDTEDANAPFPGRPFLLGILARDVSSKACDWSIEDKAAFAEWLDSPRTRAWLRDVQDELLSLVATVRPALPDNLKGVLDGD